MSAVFREKALERLSSPERLDQLMRVTSPRGWLALVTFAGLVAVALLWSVLGRLPSTVAGRGVLIHPRQVVDFQAPAAGRLITLSVQAGDMVNAGDVLGVIDQGGLRQQLQDKRARLQELLTQDQTKNQLQEQQTALQRQKTDLEKRSLQLQFDDAQKRLSDAEARAPLLKERFDTRLKAETLGLASKISDQRMQAEQAYLENQDRIAEFRAKLKQLESQLKQLDGQEKRLVLENLEAVTTRKNQIQELKSSIAVDEIQLERNSQIISKHPGRVVELAVNLGQMLQVGHRLGSIAVADDASTLVGMTYFPVEAGKKIAPGMKVQIAPDPVERQRYGSILGTVTSVSAFLVTKEGMASRIGNAEVVNVLVAQGRPAIEVVATLELDAATFSGYRWSSSQGPELHMTPGTTTTGRVVVEQRAPITYLLPFLRDISGLY
jgi:HlyD family secretion protein